MIYYWTSEPENPPVYHDNSACSEGKKILATNKNTSTIAPAGRTLCSVCKRL